MVETKRVQSSISVDGAILGAETQAVSTTAQNLGTIGFTIPSNCTEIILYNPDGSIEQRWHPTGTPTATYGHNIAPGDLDKVPHHQLSTFLIRSDSGTPNLTAIYLG